MKILVIARLLEKLSRDTRQGDNVNEFEGGYRLWRRRYNGSTSERFAH